MADHSTTSPLSVDSYARPFLSLPSQPRGPIWRTVGKSDGKRKNGHAMPTPTGGLMIDPQSVTIANLQARIDEMERERRICKVRVVNPEVLCREDLVRDNFRLQEEVARLKGARDLDAEGAGSPSVTCECPPDLAQKVQDYEGLISRLKGEYLELRKRQDALLGRNMALARAVYSLEQTNMGQAERITELELRVMRSKRALQALSRTQQEAEKAQQHMQALTSAMATQLSEWQADDVVEASNSDACIVA